jgi:hypothetical protein
MRLFRTFLAAFALALTALPSWAAITQQQATTLKAACTADPTCLGLMQAADDVGMAAWFNTVEAAYIVWRSDVTTTEARKVMVWTEIDALTAGKARIWDWMREGGVLDARDTNIRQGLSDAFSAATATRTALIALAKRAATRAEKALATGAGTSGSPSIMTFVGSITYADASLIRVS